MQSLDIILVSYNSEKWIEKCLLSIEKSNYPLKSIYLTFVDNSSTDDSVSILENYTGKHLFGSYSICSLPKNLGFGPANNIGVQKTNQPYVFFLNIDTELEPSAIHELMRAVRESDDKVALWEARQFPYEHPKIYNPVTMQTSWASAAACLVRRDYFVEVGAFDEKIFMYGEDVDLSWRFRAHGLKLVYVPRSIVYHYTYEKAGEVKPNQFYNSTFNNLMLRYKFGNWKDILKGYFHFVRLITVNGPSKEHKRILFKNLTRSLFVGLKFRAWFRKNIHLGFKPNFFSWDYEVIRDGAFYENQLPNEQPLVSILVRTCGRPDVLREALLSVRNQTYRNIEVVVVEDGPDLARKMIEEEFLNMNIVYTATGEKVGRCEVGNHALKLAKGKYFNFLDDDDVLYADHLEVLCKSLMNNPRYKAAYSVAFETPIKVISREPYQYRELSYYVRYKEKFNRLMLLQHNYFPIQTVLFAKEIYDDLGGFDKSLYYLEDWDLWLRYGLHYDFLFVDKLTSIYRVPATIAENQTRQDKLDQYINLVRQKHCNEQVNLTVGEALSDIQEILNRQSVICRLGNMSPRFLLSIIKNKLYTKVRKRLLS